jgi:hypothetical protein
MSMKVNNSRFEVNTPAGWRKFAGMKKTTVPVHVVLLLSSGNEIKCSPTHKIKDVGGTFMNAMDIEVGTKLSDTITVLNNTFKHEPLEVFDLRGVDGEEYITDDIISHNCAFIDAADIIWTAASSTLSTGGQAILLSTPNGVGNFFHKMWQQAESKENGFNPILLDWRVHPERDQAWRDRQTELMGELQAIQEHDASFIFSGNTVVPAEILEFYKKTYVQDPLSKEGFDGNLWVWEYPHSSKSYIVCADVARGDGEDYSTFHVIDIESSTQVAEYKGKIETKAFGNMLVSIATQYNDALLIPDNSSIGWNAIQQIIDRGYRNLFYMSRDLQYVDVEHQLNGKYHREERGMVPGFMISQRTRPLIINRLKEYMLETSFTIRSSRMIAELETFIWKNARPEALSGYNDDLVLALCIGLWVRDTALRLRQEGIELTKLAIDKTKYELGTMVYTDKNISHNPYEMQVGQEKENIRWLL